VLDLDGLLATLTASVEKVKTDRKDKESAA